MLKALWKLLIVFLGVFAALVGFSYWSRSRTPRYIEIYTTEQKEKLY